MIGTKYDFNGIELLCTLRDCINIIKCAACCMAPTSLQPALRRENMRQCRDRRTRGEHLGCCTSWGAGKVANSSVSSIPDWLLSQLFFFLSSGSCRFMGRGSQGPWSAVKRGRSVGRLPGHHHCDQSSNPGPHAGAGPQVPTFTHHPNSALPNG